MSMQIGIVIVNYNGAKYQNECIDSILSSSFQNFKIIIVDNHSKDDSMALLDRFHDERIIRIYLEDNLGVAEGNNVGVRKSIELGMDATLLLNNDTVLQKDTIEKLVDSLKDNEDVVAPLIMYWSDKSKIWYGGGYFNRKRGITVHSYIKEQLDKQNFDDYVEYSSTCCLLVRNTVFAKVGLFDSKYFMYFDDTDFMMRLNISKIKIRFNHEAVMYHKVSLSTGGEGSKLSTYYCNRNRFYFIKKYKNQFSKTAYLFSYWSRKFKYVKSFFTKSNDRCIRKAYLDYKSGHMGRCDNI